MIVKTTTELLAAASAGEPLIILKRGVRFELDSPPLVLPGGCTLICRGATLVATDTGSIPISDPTSSVIHGFDATVIDPTIRCDGFTGSGLFHRGELICTNPNVVGYRRKAIQCVDNGSKVDKVIVTGLRCSSE